MALFRHSRKSASTPFRNGVITTGCLAIWGSLVVVSFPRWERFCLTWGATSEEAADYLLGDELLENPDIVTTRAISIAAPTQAVWPWLAQMGSGRGGVYTYDWIENLFGLDMHSVDVVLRQVQDIKIGDAQSLAKNGPKLRVAAANLQSALVLRSDDGNWVWGFTLLAEDSGTRLISRNRIAAPGSSCLSRAFYRYVMVPGSLVMERKMLLGIRQRAEGLALDSDRS